jgi:hypothetical protein
VNPSAMSPRFDDLDGLLRSAVEQIIALPPPAESAERVLVQAAKWSATAGVGVPASAGNSSSTGRLKAELQRGRSAYLVAGAALALVVLLAVGFAMMGGLPREKPIAVSPKVEQTEPKVNPPDSASPVAPPADVAVGRGIDLPAMLLPRFGTEQATELSLMQASNLIEELRAGNTADEPC